MPAFCGQCGWLADECTCKDGPSDIRCANLPEPGRPQVPGYDQGGEPFGCRTYPPKISGLKPMRSTEQFLADCRAISDVLPSELVAGDYFAINKHNGEHCIVRLSGESPQLVLGCLQFPLRTSIKDFRFLDRVPTWERYRELAEAAAF